MSKSREALSLLRTANRVRSLRPPRRCLATAFASPFGSQHPYNHPSFPYRNSGGDIGIDAVPTSSAITLDHPFWSARPAADDTALAYATDDELFNALLLPTVVVRPRNQDRGEEVKAESKARSRLADILPRKWISPIDPASAFIALRSRPTYTAFLQCIHPFLSNVYVRLKEAELHQVLVSDLLLRHPDPRLLRDLLELDARDRTIPFGQSEKKRLRSSLVVSIHSIIGWQIRRGSLARLDYRTILVLCRAYLEQEDIPALLAAWHDLRRSFRNPDKASAYKLLTLAVSASRLEPVHAFSMLHSLVKDGTLPPGILLRGLGDHPRRRQILVTAAAVDSCLRWGMDERARTHAEQMLELVHQAGDRSDAVAQGRAAMELLFKVMRSAVVTAGAEEMLWCRRIIVKVGRMLSTSSEIAAPLRDMMKSLELEQPNAAPTATSLAAEGPLVDAVIHAEKAVHVREPPRPESSFTSGDMWRALPETVRPVLSAPSILYLAQQSKSAEERIDHFHHLAQLDPIATVPLAEPLLDLARIHQGVPVSRTQRDIMLSTLLRHWSGHVTLGSPAALIHLVQRMRADRPRCLALVRTYEARLFAEYARRGEASDKDKLAMVYAFLLLKDAQAAGLWFHELDMQDKQVRVEMWKMSAGNSDVRQGLRTLLRGVMDPREVNKILKGKDHSISSFIAV